MRVNPSNRYESSGSVLQFSFYFCRAGPPSMVQRFRSKNEMWARSLVSTWVPKILNRTSSRTRIFLVEKVCKRSFLILSCLLLTEIFLHSLEMKLKLYFDLYLIHNSLLNMSDESGRLSLVVIIC